MKKLMITVLMAILPSVSFALEDFNSLIEENKAAQQELHKVVKQNVAAAQSVQPREKVVIVENTVETYVAPTQQDLLVYKKEKINHRSSEVKRLNRLSSEFNNL